MRLESFILSVAIAAALLLTCPVWVPFLVGAWAYEGYMYLRERLAKPPAPS